MVIDIVVWCQEEENCVKHWYLQYTALSIDEKTLWTDLYMKIQDQYCLLFPRWKCSMFSNHVDNVSELCEQIYA